MSPSVLFPSARSLAVVFLASSSSCADVHGMHISGVYPFSADLSVAVPSPGFGRSLTIASMFCFCIFTPLWINGFAPFFFPHFPSFSYPCLLLPFLVLTPQPLPPPPLRPPVTEAEAPPAPWLLGTERGTQGHRADDSSASSPSSNDWSSHGSPSSSIEEAGPCRTCPYG